MNIRRTPMTLRNATDLAREAARIVRGQGLRELARRTKHRLIRRDIDSAIWRHSQAFQASAFARECDFTIDDIHRSQARTRSNGAPLRIESINWYLPPFAHAFYGGMQTILRFAAHFKERHGVRNTFVIVGSHGDPPDFLQRITAAFPTLAGSATILARGDRGQNVPDAHAAVATFWPTAYPLLKANNVDQKFYFVQDYEPLFYPAGSTSAQAESTYRFGFRGITNTVSLKNHYENDFGGSATFFNPCVDTRLFFPLPERDWTKRPFKVFFYARPSVHRNGFEIGAAALKKVKLHFGDDVEIICAGAPWDETAHGLDGVFTNRGFLTYQETAEIYRNADVGLSMMFTRHPSYLPFELMASGCLVVSNHNSATTWLLKDEVNCLLAFASAGCIAQRIIEGLEDVDRRRRIASNALSLITSQFSDWASQTENVFRYMQNEA